MRLIERLKQILSWKIKLYFCHILNGNQVGSATFLTLSHYLKCFKTHAPVNAKIIESLLFHSVFPFLPLFLSQVPLYTGHVIRIPWTPGFSRQCLDFQTPAWMWSLKPSVPKESFPFSFSLFSTQALMQCLEAILTMGTFTIWKNFWSLSESGFELWSVKVHSDGVVLLRLFTHAH